MFTYTDSSIKFTVTNFIDNGNYQKFGRPTALLSPTMCNYIRIPAAVTGSSRIRLPCCLVRIGPMSTEVSELLSLSWYLPAPLDLSTFLPGSLSRLLRLAPLVPRPGVAAAGWAAVVLLDFSPLSGPGTATRENLSIYQFINLFVHWLIIGAIILLVWAPLDTLLSVSLLRWLY